MSRRSPYRTRTGRQHGQGAIEYAIILTLLSMLALGALGALGQRTKIALCSISNGFASAGSLAAWGDNTYSQIGPVGVGTTITTPTAVNGICSVAVSAGGYHTLAIKPDGTVWGWGDNSYGQLGNGSVGGSYSAPQQIPGLPVGKTAVSVAAGFHSVVLFSDGSVYAWGLNTLGSAGDGAFTGSACAGGNACVTTPTQVCAAAPTGCAGKLSGITSIAAGGEHTLAIRNDGTLWSWGWNSNGQIGPNGVAPCNACGNNLPVQVTGLPVGPTIKAVDGGWQHSLVLMSDGSVYTFGAGYRGQLGNNVDHNNTGASGPGNATSPVQVSGAGGVGFLTNVITIEKGSVPNHNIVVRSDGTVWSWGQDDSGELGDNSTVGDNGVGGAPSGCFCKNYPVQVLGVNGTGFLTNVTSLARGNGISFAARGNGTIVAWGLDNASQLGVVSGGSGWNAGCSCYAVPQAVPGVSLAKFVTAGFGHAIALIQPGGTPVPTG